MSAAWAFLIVGCVRGLGEPVSEVPGDLLSVSESSSGRLLFLNPIDGRYRGELCLSELFPEVCVQDDPDFAPCLIFSTAHAFESGQSTFQITYSIRDTEVGHSPAGIISITPEHPPQVRWQLDALSFPAGTEEAELCSSPTSSMCFLNGTHIIEEDEDGVLVAADTNNSRVLWIEPGADTTGTVTAILGPNHSDWADWRNVNHLQILREGDRVYLLTTFKARFLGSEGLSDQGQLVMWDVTDRSSPERLWAWPEGGYLAAVHHGIVQDTSLGPMLIYAHSLGASDDPDQGLSGSVGFARYNGPQTPPTYLADGLLPAGEQALGFVREAEVFQPGDWLLVTDSGCENPSADCSMRGRLLSIRLPDLSPAEQSGSHGDQRFIDLEVIPDARRHELVFPYEADLFYSDEVDPAVLEGIGACPAE